jgi:hypothetical protein
MAKDTVSDPVQEINPATDAKVIERSQLGLTADNIIERTEADGNTLIYDVEDDGKVLFSTLSEPLAFAWASGHNIGMARTAKPNAKVDKPDAKEGVDHEDVDAKNDNDNAAKPDKSDKQAAPSKPTRQRNAL